MVVMSSFSGCVSNRNGQKSEGCFGGTVCPGRSAPPEKIFNIFASKNEVYTIY